jgi:tartronate-semialdehyde synthase
LIDLPLDVQKADVEVDFDPRRGGRLPFPKPAPNPNATRQVVEMILEAERPILMPGGGVIIAEASEELVEFAEYLQVPVNPTYTGKGAIREDHPLYAGIVGLQTQQHSANAIFLESDLVVGIGNRWAERHTGDLDVYRGNRKFVHIDIDPRQLGRVFRPDLAVVSTPSWPWSPYWISRDMTSAREPGAWVERVDELCSTLLRKMDFATTFR